MINSNKRAIKKFLILLIIIASYFTYLSLKFGASSGFLLAFLTWSFFVLCTPIADAGFLLDFPLRFFLGIRMLIAEIAVWVVAILGNILAIIFASSQYEKTYLTNLFYKILTQPNPYFAIIFLSFIGTFFSIKVGDDIYDIIANKGEIKSRRRFVIKIFAMLTILVFTIILYKNLLNSLQIKEF